MKKAIGLSFILIFLFSGVVNASSNESRLNMAIEKVLGTPYKWGGTTTDGFDCSGLINYIFAQFDTKVSRTSLSQSEEGSPVDKKELRAGDLVFFNTSGTGISHAGIYLGNDQFAHASGSKGVIISILSDAYYDKRYVTARRLVDDRIYNVMIQDEYNW